MTPGGIWAGLDRLIDAAHSLEGPTSHRLHLLTARRWRATGRPVPDRLGLEELIALQHEADARAVLRQARDAYDGELMLLKGLEVGAHYPAPGLRPFADIDLLADDPERAQAALVAAGFEPFGEFDDAYYDGLHHLRPLASPDGTVAIEMHRRPNWIDWLEPPRRDELIGLAVPSAAGVDGITTLPREHHALVIAAHSWGERPLRRMIDLVDAAALADGADRALIEATAARWGMARLWRTTSDVADALLRGHGEPFPLRVWARDLRTLRERSVFEEHARSWLSPFAVFAPGRALLALAAQIRDDLTPAPGETWSNKLVRAREAVLHPGRSTTEHVRAIGPEGIQPRHKRRPD